jgi:16S rRNA (cytidine1402-2'-O)-methyltransferase
MESFMTAPLDPGLYIVATPIGNLGDITFRASEVLRGVAAVACEDTRVTGKLLKHLGIKQRLIRYDDHASDETLGFLLGLMAEIPVALVSDAGTPLISDPGYQLVRAARAAGLAVTSLPRPVFVRRVFAGQGNDKAECNGRIGGGSGNFGVLRIRSQALRYTFDDR